MTEQSSVATTQSPPGPYDADDALHIDEFPPYNGDRLAAFAFDDEGNRYKVGSGDRFPSTEFISEDQWSENVLPERKGVGEECAECGETVEWNATIVNSQFDLLPRVNAEESHHRISGRAKRPVGFKTHTFQASSAGLHRC